MTVGGRSSALAALTVVVSVARALPPDLSTLEFAAFVVACGAFGAGVVLVDELKFDAGTVLNLPPKGGR